MIGMSSTNSQMKAGALFSGIGGFCVGFREHGIETAWAVENDPAAVSTYSANLGSEKIIRKNGAPESIVDVSVEDSKLCEVDLVHAGFPCQSFSVAGDRKGFDDPRGQLFYHIIKILNQFEDNRPSVLVLENSPNLRIGDSGSWFLEVSARIKKAGYWFRESNAFELDSFEHTSVPQKRNRLFLVAFSTNKFKNGKLNLSLPKFSEHKSVSDFINFDGEVEDDSYYLDKNNKYYKMITDKIDHPRSILQLRKYEVRDKGLNVVPTLTANMGQGGHNVPFIMDQKGLRKLTEQECLKIQGFPDGYYFPADVPRAKRYQQVGNSVVPPLVSLLAAAIRQKIEQDRL